ncbi:hypothetical protein N7456_003456 [Penicillium angulare]|uniref:DNA-directed RNA polymerase n=1 Tax=Penicillium angulare TaxID=116970 RepID=A0A9W9FUN4_9EURO|nr:hypothetical protein N7456_003456 [Penicillium angulare]
MLSRVARQKNAIFHLRKANAHRVLGASSTPRLHYSSARSSPVMNSPSNRASEKRRPSFQSSHRNLATAADPFVLDQPSYSSIVDESSLSHAMEPPINPKSLFSNIEFDPSSLIIVEQEPTTQPTIFRKVRGIGGDPNEMMANFDMSLKVGRFDRAATLLTRLRSVYTADSVEFTHLHNRYLKEMISHMIVYRQSEMVHPVQRWFERDMSALGVKPDPITYASMIRMALRMLHGSKRDRTVRRYWELAKKEDLHEDLLAVEILTDLDLGELSEICSSDLGHAKIDLEEIQNSVDLSPQNTDQIAEVLAADQKGLGLTSLKESLGLFADKFQISLPADFEGTEEQRKELYNQLRQRQLEADTIKSARNRWRAEYEGMTKAGIDTMTSKKQINTVISQWHGDLVLKIKNELKMAEEEEGKPIRTTAQLNRCEYSVFLKCLDVDRLAAITILATVASFTRAGVDKGVKISAVASTVGRDIQDELIADACLKKAANQDSRRAKVLKELLGDRKSKTGRMRWKNMSESMQVEDPTLSWNSRIQVRVGAVLTCFLFDVAKAPVKSKNDKTGKVVRSMQPAFQHLYQITFGKRLGLLHLHPEIVKIVKSEPPVDLLGRHLPMVCAPKPWTGAKDGGYLIYQSNIVRTTPGEGLQPLYVKTALEKDGLKEIRHGLDVLGGTGWVINRDVFDVMLEAWNSGEDVANLSPLEPDLQLPPKPDPSAGPEAEKAWQNQMRDLENQRSGFHSQRCFQNFQMEVARSFRNETFYLPHNMDFRGRAYPLPPYLNQMGADNARGLLLFSKAKPLGVNGMRWLKIHIANLAGFDKASMAEREQFAVDNLDSILDSANNGLKGKRWWLKAEDPWQCLAACCELRNALRHSDPLQYPSRLPVHQDGSCNGLQHYAALGGDSVGAQQVNLEPSDRPSDVYTGVSDYVKKAVAADAAQGHQMAKVLDGKITRKIVKQTVMTNVYGVTFMGAMRQVRRQLVDHYPEMSVEQKKAGSLYIARKIFQALGTMFNGASEIQHWLGDCASRITQSISPDQIDQIAKEVMSPNSDESATASKALDPAKRFRSTVIWTTPLGLPVVQPYRTRKARRVQTSLQDINVVDYSTEDVVSRRKQLQAFPPNFIHSLDATHMMLSANACERAGLTFSAVHDSFWTHAGDIDTMNHILRDAFVHMHSDDVIGRLAAEFNIRYSKNLFLAKLPAKNPIAKAIRASRKTAGNNQKIMDLFAESRRQALLRSEDPAEQAEGRAMQTAAGIFESLGGSDSDLVISSSLGAAEVGQIPEDLAAAERRPDANIDFSDPAISSLFTELDMMDSKDTSSDNGIIDADDAADASASTKKKPAQGAYTWLWLPLRFRNVPAKGTWDITRIRDSQYFFS